MKQAINVIIINEVSTCKVAEPLIINALKLAHKKNNVQQPTAVSLLIVDDNRIKQLNKMYKQRDEATDVLAFSDGEVDESDHVLYLGDIIISAETASREAKILEIDWQHELTFYALHGFYHLLGMDDKTKEQKQAMFKKQSDIMLELGISMPIVENENEEL